jgi:4-hydroxy-3-polyprenylbenzoate decarboxylase
MSLALGAEDLEERAKDIVRILEFKPEGSGLLDKLKMLPFLTELSRFLPTEVSKAPCQEVVEEEVDLTRLPVLTCWPQDGDLS